MAKHIVTVFGATGSQGGSLVDSLLKEGFTVRAISRKATGDGAKKLKEKGAEVVELNMVASSVDQIATALKGSYGAFLLTNFWDPDSMGKETDLGKKLVDAAAAAKVPHIVWSALENVEKISHKKYHVPHFTDKAKVTEYVHSLQAKSPKAFKTFTLAAPAFYFQNFTQFGIAKVEGDTTVFNFPPVRFLTGCDITEFGPATAQAFKHPEKFDGKRIEYWGEHASIQSYVETYQRVTGKKAKLNLVPFDIYSKLPFPGAEELAQMYGWFDEFGYYGPDGQPMALHSAQHQTHGGLSSFETFCKKGGMDFKQ